MKFNFNKNILSLSGEELKDEKENPINLGKFLANQLVSASKGDAMKMSDLAQRLWKGEEVEIDRSDRKMLEDFIKEAATMNILVKGQLLDVLEKGEDTTVKSEK